MQPLYRISISWRFECSLEYLDPDINSENIYLV